MNLPQAPFLPAPRADNSPIFQARPVTLKTQTWRNQPRKSGLDRDAEILAAVRGHDHAVRFAAIAERVRLGRSALADRLRAMVEGGKLKRMKVNAKDYVYYA